MAPPTEAIMTSLNFFPDDSAHAPRLTLHAAVRMQQRGLCPADVRATLNYGRRIHAKGVTFYVVGRKEVKRYSEIGINLSELDGVQVLVAGDGAVITAYRNRDLHSIKVDSRMQRRQARKNQHNN
jgi:hypothetical protein